MPLSRPRKRKTIAVDRDAVDREHLDLLSVFHYIVGGLTILMSCTFLALPIIGMDMQETGNPRGHLWVVGGIAGMILGFVLSIFLMLAGYLIARRRARIFTLIMAMFDLFLFPFGTLLGVCTFTVLGRDSIKSLYATAKG